MDTSEQNEKAKAMAIATACRTHRREKQSKPGMSNAVDGTTQRRIRRKRRELMKQEKKNRAGVEMRIRALQRIVPGGETVVGVDKLFEQTADYILELQTQVKAMKVLATFFEGLEREKMKFGG